MITQKFEAYKEIENLINNTLNVRTISELLVCFDLDTDPCVVKSFLIDNRFDVVGVQHKQSIVGYADLKTLEVSEKKLSYNEFRSNDIVSSNTPLLDTINLLSERDHLFVLDGTSIKRIVTKADIYKDPVRLFIYNLLSNFEVLLSILIEYHYPENEWKTNLTEKRLNKIYEVYLDRKEENTDFDLFDCLSIEDKIKLFSNKDKTLRDLMDINYTQQRKYFKNLKKIRNSISHVGKKPAVTDIEKILDTIAKTTKYSKVLEREIVNNKIVV